MAPTCGRSIMMAASWILRRAYQLEQRMRFLVECSIIAIQNRSNPRLAVREETIWSLNGRLHYEIFRATVDLVEEHDNWIYFAGPIWFRNRISSLGDLYDSVFRKRLTITQATTGTAQEWFPFLYPPNLATIDFLERVSHDHSLGVLDFGCGIGGLGVYLSDLQYSVWLYDNASQMSLDVLDRFWSTFNLQTRLARDLSTVKDLPIFAVNCVGTALTQGGLDVIRSNRSIQYVFLDTQGNVPFGLPGFRLIGYYPGLIYVLRRL